MAESKPRSSKRPIDLDQCTRSHWPHPVSCGTGRGRVVLVVPWLLVREYRQHRALDDELPATYAKWLATVDAHLEREAGETRLRIVKVVIHPGEIETWASNTGGRQVNEQARSDYADLMWRKEVDRWRAGGGKTPVGALAEQQPRAPCPGSAVHAQSRHLARCGHSDMARIGIVPRSASVQRANRTAVRGASNHEPMRTR
jgi:hypothetical protein